MALPCDAPSALTGLDKRGRFGGRRAPGGDEAHRGEQGDEQCSANEVPHSDPVLNGCGAARPFEQLTVKGWLTPRIQIRLMIRKSRRARDPHEAPAIHAVSG